MESTTQFRATVCPSRDVLLAYCRGSLPDIDQDTVDSHLATCESCLAFLDSQHPGGQGSSKHAQPVVLFSDEESAKSSLLDDTSLEKLRGDSELQRLKARAKAIKIDFDFATRDMGPLFPALPKPADEKLPEKIGRYFVIKKLGNGAFANVYLARDPEQDRLVAIKVPRPDRFEDASQIEDYLREARTAAVLDHPHIVRDLDFGRTDDGSCYVVMKYIEGTTLEAAMTAERFSVERIAQLLVQIADALDHAHQKGIFHRDVKPANILLDKNGLAYVADFGLAIQEETQHLHRDERAGTWPYMSPEQIRGKSHHLDARSDVWSLGVIMYELLTREKPFPSKVKADLEDEIQNREPKPPRSIDRQIPANLERISLWCLEKTVTARCPSAAALAQDLRTWLTGLEQPAVPTPSLRPMTLLAGLAITVLLAVTGISLYLAFFGDKEQSPIEKKSQITVGNKEQALPKTSGVPPVDEPKSSISGNANEAAAWRKRLGSDPKEILWPGYRGQPSLTFLEEPRVLNITSSSPCLVELGSISDDSVFVSLGVKQPSWSGACGLYLGYQEKQRDGHTWAYFQTIVIEPRKGATGARHLRIARMISRISPTTGTLSGNDPVSEQILTWPPRDTFPRLELELSPRGILSGRWGNQEFNEETCEVANQKIKPEYRQGRWGLFHEVGTSWFQDPKISHTNTR